MSGQTFAAGSRVTGTQLTNVVYQNAVNLSVTASADTTTSATYVNLAATSSVSFTKQLTSTNILVSLSFGWSATTNIVVLRAGVLINGVDTDVMRQILGTGGVGVISGEAIVTGVSAGTYTCQARWRREAGSGTANRIAANDWLTMTISEVT